MSGPQRAPLPAHWERGWGEGLLPRDRLLDASPVGQWSTSPLSDDGWRSSHLEWRAQVRAWSRHGQVPTPASPRRPPAAMWRGDACISIDLGPDDIGGEQASLAQFGAPGVGVREGAPGEVGAAHALTFAMRGATGYPPGAPFCATRATLGNSASALALRLPRTRDESALGISRQPEPRTSPHWCRRCHSASGSRPDPARRNL